MPKKSLKEMRAELKRLRLQIQEIEGSTRLKGEISKAKHRKHAASFAELVGKFRRAGMGFAAAARRASKEYRKAEKGYGKAKRKYGSI